MNDNLIYVTRALIAFTQKHVQVKRPYPYHVFFILGNEFCERFAYYGMRGWFIVYNCILKNLSFVSISAQIAVAFNCVVKCGVQRFQSSTCLTGSCYQRMLRLPYITRLLPYATFRHYLVQCLLMAIQGGSSKFKHYTDLISIGVNDVIMYSPQILP